MNIHIHVHSDERTEILLRKIDKNMSDINDLVAEANTKLDALMISFGALRLAVEAFIAGHPDVDTSGLAAAIGKIDAVESGIEAVEAEVPAAPAPPAES